MFELETGENRLHTYENFSLSFSIQILIRRRCFHKSLIQAYFHLYKNHGLKDLLDASSTNIIHGNSLFKDFKVQILSAPDLTFYRFYW